MVATSTPTDSPVDNALLGVATGFLSQVGPTAVIVNADPDRLPTFLTGQGVERLLLLGSLGEVLANAFVSFLPGRNRPPVLFQRMAFGAVAAALLASTRKGDVGQGALIGATTAGAAAVVSTPLRAMLGKVVPDLVVALGETVLAIVLARRATR